MDTKAAAAEIKKLIPLFEGLAHIRDVLQAAEQAEAKISHADKTAAAAKADAAKAHEHKDRAIHAKGEAEKQAAKILADAQAKATDLVSGAEAAKSRAERFVAESVSKAKADSEALLAAANKQLTTLQDSISKAQSDLSAIEAKVAAYKAAAAKALEA